MQKKVINASVAILDMAYYFGDSPVFFMNQYFYFSILYLASQNYYKRYTTQMFNMDCLLAMVHFTVDYNSSQVLYYPLYMHISPSKFE